MRKPTPILLSVTVFVIVSLACAVTNVPAPTEDINSLGTAVMATMVSAPGREASPRQRRAAGADRFGTRSVPPLGGGAGRAAVDAVRIVQGEAGGAHSACGHHVDDLAAAPLDLRELGPDMGLEVLQIDAGGAEDVERHGARHARAAAAVESGEGRGVPAAIRRAPVVFGLMPSGWVMDGMPMTPASRDGTSAVSCSAASDT